MSSSRPLLALAFALAGCSGASPPARRAPPATPPAPAPASPLWADATCATDSEVDVALRGLDPPLARPTADAVWDGPVACAVTSVARADLTGDGHPEVVLTVRFERSARFEGPDGAPREHHARATMFAVFDARPTPHALLRLDPLDPAGTPVSLQIHEGRLRSVDESCSDCGCDRFATWWRWDGAALVPEGDAELVHGSGDCDM